MKLSQWLTLGLLLLQTGYTVDIGQVDISHLPAVTIYVNVDDADGRPVTDLTQSDFTLTEDGIPIQIEKFAGVGDARPADIVFLFDTTGSMSEEIDGVIRTSTNFANQLERNGRDYRLGLVTFGDSIRGIYGPNGQLTNNVAEFKRWVSGLRADGGDDDPEYSLGAIKAATRMQFRESSQVVFILITDAPPHHYGDPPQSEGNFNDPDLTYDRTLALLQTPRAITLYAVTYENPEFRKIAAETGGQFYDIENISDFTNIIDRLGLVIAAQYRLTYVTPRPDYDGTRRNIQVTVGNSLGQSEYLEPHLVNIRSNLVIGLWCSLPLIVATLFPILGRRFSKKKLTRNSDSAPATSPPLDQSLGIGPARMEEIIEQPIENTCPHCRQPVRAQAIFCTACGWSLKVFSVTPAEGQGIALSLCRQCGNPVSLNARFCKHCGTRLKT